MNAEAENMLTRFRAQRLIPVFYHADVERSVSILTACYRAGLTVFEYTNRGPYALVNFRLLKAATPTLPKLRLGIGTIFSLRDAEAFVDAGADFIVSPALIPEMAEVQQNYNIPWIPGCATVSEVAQAQALGARLIKIYPADQLGPAFIRSLKTVLPDVWLMPTGGIAADTVELDRWFRAGAACVGLGSQLFSSELIAPANENQLFQKLQELAKWANQPH